MKLSYRQIEYIDQVARCGGLTAACREMNISQSSVLAAVDAAESATGVRLFVRRKGQGLALTPAGHNFMVGVRRFLAAGEDFFGALQSFPDSDVSSLSIGCFAPLGAMVLTEAMQRFLEREPNCELSLHEGDQTQLRTWLREGLVDLVVTYDLGEEFCGGVTPICRFPTHALLHKSDPLADSRFISLAELSTRPLVLLDLPETRGYLTSLFDFTGSRPKIALRTKAYETVRNAVASGLGMSVLNVRPMGDVSPDSPNLVRLPLSDRLRQPMLLVVDPYGDAKPMRVRAFIRILYDQFARAGPENFAVSQPKYWSQLLCQPPEF